MESAIFMLIKKQKLYVIKQRRIIFIFISYTCQKRFFRTIGLRVGKWLFLLDKYRVFKDDTW